MSVFLCCVLSKKYPHPSSDIISVLAGLDRIDTVFTEFVGILDDVIRNDKDCASPAIEALCYSSSEWRGVLTVAKYSTSAIQGRGSAPGGDGWGVPDNFAHLPDPEGSFPLSYESKCQPASSSASGNWAGETNGAQFVQHSEAPGQALEPFTLLGLLANYNKFEFQNPYQMRLNDFVNEASIQKIVRCVGDTCQALRSGYVLVQDDLPEGWTFNSTLNMIGLGAIVPGPRPEKRPVYDAETAKQMLSRL